MLASVAVPAPPKPRTLEDIKALIYKAKLKQEEASTTQLQDQIADLQQEIEMLNAREHSALMEVKVLQKQVEEDSIALADTRQNRDALALINENPDAIIAEVETMLADIKAKLASVSATISSIQKEKLEKTQQVSNLRDRTYSANKPKPTSASTVSPPTSKYKQERIDRQLSNCRPDIKMLYKQAQDMPYKMTAYLNDRDARTYFIQECAARVKIFQADADYYKLIDDENQILFEIIGILARCSKQYGTSFIHALGRDLKPRNTATWSEYLAHTLRDMNNFFNPAIRKEPANFGVVRPPEAPVITPPVIEEKKPAPVIITPPARIEVPAIIKPPKEESPERLVKKIIESSGLLIKTTGKRVAMIAGQQGKNKPLQMFIEEMLSFKRLTWHDGRKNDDLINSIKAQGIDLLLAIPAWHKGYKYFTDFAEKAGIQTIILSEHNKFKVIEQIAAAYNIPIKCPA